MDNTTLEERITAIAQIIEQENKGVDVFTPKYKKGRLPLISKIDPLAPICNRCVAKQSNQSSIIHTGIYSTDMPNTNSGLWLRALELKQKTKNT